MVNEMIKVGIGVMILKENHILLGHRVKNGQDTGGIYEPDSWCLPGGKQEYNETIFECAQREVKEETNLDIDDMMVFGAIDDIQPNKHFVTIWVIAKECQGTLQVMEKDKQDAWAWYSLDELPEYLYSPSQKFIDAYLKSVKKEL